MQTEEAVRLTEAQISDLEKARAEWRVKELLQEARRALPLMEMAQKSALFKGLTRASVSLRAITIVTRDQIEAIMRARQQAEFNRFEYEQKLLSSPGDLDT